MNNPKNASKKIDKFVEHYVIIKVPISVHLVINLCS